MIWTLIGTLVLNPVLPALGQVVAAGGGTTVELAVRALRLAAT
ncbi:hypothetical protein [Azonexus hydrophilus]